MLAQRHVPFMPSLGGRGFEGGLGDIVLGIGLLDVISILEMIWSVVSFVSSRRVYRVRRFERHFSRTEDARSFDRQ
jgi:hypothetical protein